MAPELVSLCQPELGVPTAVGPHGPLNFGLHKIAIRKRGDSTVFNESCFLLISQNDIKRH